VQSEYHDISDRVVGDIEIQRRWLVRIRSVASISLIAIFAFIGVFLDTELSWPVVSGVVSLSLVSNIALSRFTLDNRNTFLFFGGLAILLDVALLGVLLYLSGGYANPFSMMFLAYIILAGTVLDTRWTWTTYVACSGSFIALFFYHVPVSQLAMHHGAHLSQNRDSGFSLHLHGMLIAFVVIGAISSWFLTRMNREMGEQAETIQTLQKAESDRRRLLSLTTLTGGVAHELATPLGTLSLIADDLCEALGKEPRWSEDMRSLQSELSRCSTILARMRGTSSELQGELCERFLLSELIEEVSVQVADAGVVVFEGGFDPSLELRSLRRSLIGSIVALIRNGLQAYKVGGRVVCTIEHDVEAVNFRVVDRGQGMPEQIQNRLGEPFFTSKAPGEGMGLGVYLTKLFAMQVGGTLSFVSREGEGTEAKLIIPRIVAL
jgi:two-component system sensor histidine kinase RegB